MTEKLPDTLFGSLPTCFHLRNPRQDFSFSLAAHFGSNLQSFHVIVLKAGKMCFDVYSGHRDFS